MGLERLLGRSWIRVIGLESDAGADVFEVQRSCYCQQGCLEVAPEPVSSDRFRPRLLFPGSTELTGGTGRASCASNVSELVKHCAQICKPRSFPVLSLNFPGAAST